MNYHYQFPEPQTPIYWWKLWNSSRDLKGPLQLSLSQRRQQLQLAKQKQMELSVVDEPQKLLYELAVEYMNQRGQPGRACLERLICENAQVDEHSGLYAELLHRLLRWVVEVKEQAGRISVAKVFSHLGRINHWTRPMWMRSRWVNIAWIVAVLILKPRTAC